MGKYKRKPYGLCKMCNERPANQFHHKFSQTVNNISHYGKLIHEEFNTVDACSSCNASHANIPEDYRWGEYEFRKALKEHLPDMHNKIKPMKSYNHRLEGV